MPASTLRNAALIGLLGIASSSGGASSFGFSRSSSFGGGGGASGSLRFGFSSFSPFASASFLGSSSFFGSGSAFGSSFARSGASRPIALLKAAIAASSVLSGSSLPQYVKLFFDLG